jgi:hypothetical protein
LRGEIKERGEGDAHDIASSVLRELDAVALATNVMIFLGRDTRIRAA